MSQVGQGMIMAPVKPCNVIQGIPRPNFKFITFGTPSITHPFISIVKRAFAVPPDFFPPWVIGESDLLEMSPQTGDGSGQITLLFWLSDRWMAGFFITRVDLPVAKG